MSAWEWDEARVNRTFRGVALICYGCSTDGCKVQGDYFIDLMFKYRATVGDYEILLKDIQSLECCEESNIEFDEYDDGPRHFYTITGWDSVSVWNVKRGGQLFHADVWG